jgi:hypothetical protein
MILVEWLLVASLYSVRPQQLKVITPISDFLIFNSTHFLFVAGFLVVAILFYIFIHKYLKKVLIVPVKIFDLSLVFLVIALVVPYGTWGYIVHTICASLFAAYFFWGVLVIGLKNKYAFIRNISYLSVILLILTLALITALDTQAILLSEFSIGLFGQVWIFLISIHRFDKQTHP